MLNEMDLKNTKLNKVEVTKKYESELKDFGYIKERLVEDLKGTYLGYLFKYKGNGYFEVHKDHPFIKGHTIDLGNKKVDIVPGIVIKGLLLSLFGLRGKNLENKVLNIRYNGMLRGGDKFKVNKDSYKNFFVTKIVDNGLNLEKLVLLEVDKHQLEQQYFADLFNDSLIDKVLTKGRRIKFEEKEKYLFQKGQFSFVNNDVYWLSGSENSLDIGDIFYGTYNVEKDLELEFLDEIIAQYGSLAVGPVLKSNDIEKGRILTLKQITNVYKISALNVGDSIKFLGEILEVNKRSVKIKYIAFVNKKIVSYGIIEGNIVPIKILKKMGG